MVLAAQGVGETLSDNGWTMLGGEPPDLDNLDDLEHVVVPELERLVTESEPGSPEWIAWATLLGTVRNRILIVRRLDGIERLLAGLAEHVSDMTEEGIRRILEDGG